ncbi:hypothetical protein MJI95_35620, partial [Salmonella enterica subsp. enterica serovar Kentucky]|nr:hypothetical protein [Salmonella enterica subsp. enterica serovar Kentucky]
IAEVKRHLQANPKTVFLIGGAKEVPYDEIIKALNLLHSAGVKDSQKPPVFNAFDGFHP